jgi:hypothetical protein
MKWPEKILATLFILAVTGVYALGIVSEYKARTATTLWVPRLPPNVELGLKPDGTVVWRMVAPFQEDLDKPDTPSDTPRP